MVRTEFELYLVNFLKLFQINFYEFLVIFYFLEDAKKLAPCIIFMDELDALAETRSPLSRSHQTLNQLLSELDGYEKFESWNLFI